MADVEPATAAAPKVAFIANNSHAPWGGSEELWSLAALHLRRRGARVLACVQNWRPQAARVDDLARAGIEIHTIRPVRAMRLREGLRARVRHAARRSLQQVTVQDAVERFAPDIVVVSQMHNLDGAGWGVALAERGIPYALLSQAASEYAWPDDSAWHVARAAYLDARASFFVSRHNLELTQCELGMDLARAEVVHNPFVVKYEQPLEWPADRDVLRLACVARLEPAAKGQDLLFETLSRPHWRARPVTLSLYGGGRNESSLRALAAYLRLESVRFGGLTADVDAVWRDHHALVLASRFEGTPLALIEAMLCHRPAIVTRVGGNADLVEEGVSGFVAEAATADAIDAALDRAWQRRTELRDMGLAAGRRVRRLVPEDPAAAFAERIAALAAARP